MSIRCKELVDKKIICENLTVGSVKAAIIELNQYKITHLEVELTKEAAELVLGAKKGGIVNLLNVSAVGTTGKTIDLKVKKGQLKIYLKAPKPHA